VAREKYAQVHLPYSGLETQLKRVSPYSRIYKIGPDPSKFEPGPIFQSVMYGEESRPHGDGGAPLEEDLNYELKTGSHGSHVSEPSSVGKTLEPSCCYMAPS